MEDTGTSETAARHSPQGQRHARKRKTNRRRTLAIVLGSFLTLGVLVVGTVFGVAKWLDSKVERFGDPFAELVEVERPTPAPTVEGKAAAVNFLILGSDSRISAGDPSSWSAGAQRTDAIMIVHLDSDREQATIMSIPRDSWVPIPGHGDAKINAAYSYGGPPLMIKTVEDLTGIRIDHFAVADFDSFTSLTDVLGGVEITVPEDAYERGKLLFKAGTHHMDGEQALKYTRQRYGLSGGDFDRVKRQQNWMRAIMSQAVDRGTLTNPVKAVNLAKTLGESLAVDNSLDGNRIVDLARGVTGMRKDSFTFMTAPTTGTGRSPDGKQSIVILDRREFDPLVEAIAKDEVTDYIDENMDDLDILGGVVR